MNKVTYNEPRAQYGKAIGISAAAGAAWGAGKYMFDTKPHMYNGCLTDTFVKNIENAFTTINDKATLNNIQFQKNLETTIDNITSVDKLKELLNKNKDDFMNLTKDDVKILSDELGNIEFDKAKSFIKNVFKKDGKYTKFYNDTVASCYDDAGKKLVFDAKKITQEKFDIVKKAINKERLGSALKSAASFTLICAAMCCITEFFVARSAKKKAKANAEAKNNNLNVNKN